MESTNEPYDTNNTINNLTNMIDLLKPNWIQKLVMDIYLTDLQEIHSKGGLHK